MRNIVLVEDSERYIDEITQLAASELSIQPDAFEVVRTEAEFHARVSGWESAPPAAFVIDVMFPYMEEGTSDEHVPSSIRKQAEEDRFYRAGLRCVYYLLKNEHLARVPIIIHSILDMADLQKDIKYPIPDEEHVKVCKKEANGHGVIDELGGILDALAP